MDTLIVVWASDPFWMDSRAACIWTPRDGQDPPLMFILHLALPKLTMADFGLPLFGCLSIAINDIISAHCVVACVSKHVPPKKMTRETEESSCQQQHSTTDKEEQGSYYGNSASNSPWQHGSNHAVVRAVQMRCSDDNQDPLYKVVMVTNIWESMPGLAKHGDWSDASWKWLSWLCQHGT